MVEELNQKWEQFGYSFYHECECKHIDHNTGVKHRHGESFEERFITLVKLPHETLTVCRDCAEDCFINMKGKAK